MSQVSTFGPEWVLDTDMKDVKNSDHGAHLTPKQAYERFGKSGTNIGVYWVDHKRWMRAVVEKSWEKDGKLFITVSFKYEHGEHLNLTDPACHPRVCIDPTKRYIVTKK